MAVYPTFENKAVRDNEASETEGREILKDEIWVTIRVDGNTELNYNADEWIKEQTEKARRGKVDPRIVEQYKIMLNAFKEGQEPPLEGTDIRHWPQVTRATAENLIRLGVRTVEDLANADENTIRRIQHGGRDMQKKAKAFLEATDGKAAQKILSLEESLNILKTQNEELLKALQEKLEKPKKVKAQ